MRPVAREDLVRGQQEIMLRFAFSETVLGPDASINLLQSLEMALRSYIDALREEFEMIKSVVPVSGRLAFECGIRGTECFLEWTHYALATYEKEGTK